MSKAISAFFSLGNFVSELFRDKDTGIADIIFDALHKEEISLSSNVSRFPIALGNPITINIKPNPRRITMEATITNNSSGISLLNNIRNSIATRSLPANREVKIKEQLEYLWLNGIIFDAVTTIGTYRNMVIENLRFPKDENTGRRLFFILSLVEVSTADVKMLNYSRIAPVARNITSARNLVGSISKKAIDAAPISDVNVQRGSALLNLTSSLGIIKR